MTAITAQSIREMVQPGRVHRRCYVDPDVFAVETERIFGRAWLYVGHESQVKSPGDYLATRLGRQPVVMIRHSDGAIHVLFNRCGHRGAMVVGDRCGSARVLRCMYHGWTYRTDGTLLATPQREGYAESGFDPTDPKYGMVRVPRIASHRGFVFASLGPDGPDLATFLGGAASSIDNLCDRAPDGEVEVVGQPFRWTQPNNWKLFLENMQDGYHPLVTHESSVRAGDDIVAEIEARGARPSFAVRLVAGNGLAPEEYDSMPLVTYDYGHSFMAAVYKAPTGDPVHDAYMAAMRRKMPAARIDEILAINRHNTIVYPNASVQAVFQQIRILFPVAVDKTEVEIWNFRLKGAPPEMYRRAITYANTINSPGNIVGPDDVEAFLRVQRGLQTEGADWVSHHRWMGRDRMTNEGLTTVSTSESTMRNQFRAWVGYMATAS